MSSHTLHSIFQAEGSQSLSPSNSELSKHAVRYLSHPLLRKVHHRHRDYSRELDI